MPFLVQVPGSELMFIPVWSADREDREAQLTAFMNHLEEAEYSIKMIDDGPEFLESVGENSPLIRLMMDPFFTSEGRIRYAEIDPIPHRN